MKREPRLNWLRRVQRPGLDTPLTSTFALLLILGLLSTLALLPTRAAAQDEGSPALAWSQVDVVERSPFSANFILVNMDDPGEGLNDPTPVEPVAGNPGTTLGEQRLNGFRAAAAVWAQTLVSPVDIYVQVSFDPLPCNAVSATIGSAGSLVSERDFSGAPLPGTLYVVSLANALAGRDLQPGPPGGIADDISIRFNSSIDNNPDCLEGNWYYGFDHNEPAGHLDMLAAAVHDLHHGLGMFNFTHEANGTLVDGPENPGIFERMMRDTDLDLTYAEMTDEQRVASAINCGKVVWTGPNVTKFAPFFLRREAPQLRVETRGAEAVYDVGTAQFGPRLSAEGVQAELQVVDDGVDNGTDGCTPLVGFTAGNIAVVDRGVCGFTTKTQNAAAAGASAVVVIDSQPSDCAPGSLGGIITVDIPTFKLSQEDGVQLKEALAAGNVRASLEFGPIDTLAGADAEGRVRLYNPKPLSSFTNWHWDIDANPDLLMEPFLTSELDVSNLDLSPMQLADIGWTLRQQCGNNEREGIEMCDGEDLFGQSCESLGFAGGTLACAQSCEEFDTSACVAE